MPTYSYTALDRAQSEVSGTVEAADPSSARSQLRDQGYRPLDVREKRSWDLNLDIPLLGGSAINTQEKAVFARQMAVLLDAGVPLLRGINILEDQTDNEEFRRILGEIGQAIQGGASFSETLAAHSRAFDGLFVNMVRAGETGGVLDVVLERLAEFAEKNYELKSKVRSATMYPTFLFCFTVGAIVFLLTFVLPTFTTLYAEMGVQMPLPTRIVMGISGFMMNWWYLLVFLPIMGWYGLRWYYGTVVGERRIDRFLLTMPLFGELFEKVATARFTRTLGTLIESGVPLLEAVDIVQDTIGNRVIAELMDEVTDSISEGGTIHEPLEASDVFEPMVTHMIAVGEETGHLSEMLERIAETYERQVDDRVDALSSMVEPILIVFMGISVGVIVLAMFLPMFQLVNVVR